jgi:hypothetical protein
MNTKDEALKLAIDFIEQVHERHGATLLGESVLNKCKASLYEQQNEPRLVSYAPDKSTCTLNIDGEEIYFDRALSEQQKPLSDEVIDEIGNAHSDEQGYIPIDAWYDFARDVEKLHKIGVKDE